jgi:hypothetical protein
MMLGAQGILAYVASMMTHEALGHGGYRLAFGGHNVMLTAWGEGCDFPGVQACGIAAAGPGVQLGAGLLAWLVLRLLSPDAAQLRYFFWQYMVFNLLVSSGYVAFRFVGLEDGSGRLSRLAWTPYAAVGVFACATGALNRTMGHGVAIGLAAASSFGAGLGLLCLPAMQRGMTRGVGSRHRFPVFHRAWTGVIRSAKLETANRRASREGAALWQTLTIAAA